MKVCIASIPHTGTWFVRSLFIDQGFEHVGEKDKPRERTVYVKHIIDQPKVDLCFDKAKRMPLVCPLRHPFLVEESWGRRQRPIDELVWCFHRLIEMTHLAYIVPVDSETREDCLRVLSDGVGIPLTTDWGAVNGRESTHSIHWTDCSPSEPIKKIASTYAGFLSRFY